MKGNKAFGAFGEAVATAYLSESGYSILDRNFSCRIGEVDIIALKDDTVVFIEVKTRSSGRFGRPSEAVSSTKQERIVKTALYYLQKNRLLDHMCRFDVIEVLMNEENNHEINHIVGAFGYSGKYGY